MTGKTMNNRIHDVLCKAQRLQPVMEKRIFPAFLFLWPLWGVWSGVDVTDAGFSLGNYRFLKDGMWFYATFLANQAGRLLMALPGGGGLLAMNLKTALLISVTVLFAYYTLKRLMPGWMAFLGEVIAVSVFWCPAVILYNSLSYVFLTFACLCLFRAVSSVPRSGRWYMAAGLFLGVNLFVRFSNALQVLLILAVWLEEYLSGRRLVRAVKDTLLCLAGYFLGAGSIFLWIAVRYGLDSYMEAIREMFSMGGDYTLSEMLAVTLEAYGTALMWAFFMAAWMIAGMLLYVLPLFKKHRILRKVIYLAGMAVLLRFYWGRGMFTVNYQDYWCMFSWMMLFLLLTVILDGIFLAGKYRAATDERFLAAMSLILILILPLGSNNYTFPILLNLFVIAPFALWMFRRIWQEHRREDRHFPWYSMGIALVLAVLVQGGLFHLCYAFRDGTDGTKRTAVVTGIPAADGMRTTAANKDELEGIYSCLQDNGLTDRSLVTYGTAPGLNYLFNMRPGLSGTWPDLASFLPEERFARELRELSGVALTGHEEALPVVILHRSEAEDEELDIDQTSQEGRKAGLLADYLEEAGYTTLYETEHYVVKTVQRTQEAESGGKSESDVDMSLSNGSIGADAPAATFGKTAFAVLPQ